MSKKRLPSDPAAINEWMAGLSREELAERTRVALGGELTGSLRGMAALDEATTQEIDLAPPPDEPSLLILTIELRGSKPRIWRRLSLPGDLTLDEVHPLFQAAMGWTNSHLHHVQPGAGRTYESPVLPHRVRHRGGRRGDARDRCPPGPGPAGPGGPADLPLRLR